MKDDDTTTSAASAAFGAAAFGAGLRVEQDGLWYQSGFGNTFESEVLVGALPRGRNTPRLVPYDLYTEQLSGTAFTMPRHVNRRTWLYRIQPSVVGTCRPFVPCGVFGKDPNDDDDNELTSSAQQQGHVDPNPMRWGPLPMPPFNNNNNDNDNNNNNNNNNDDSAESKSINFISGMKLYMSSGSPMTKYGLAIYMYAFDQSMMTPSTNDDVDDDENQDEETTTKTKKQQQQRQQKTKECMYNSDGDFLIVPQEGSLLIQTELGQLICHVKEICVIPRGMVFSVSKYNNNNKACRGYVLEVYGGHFQLPELGPIGSNGLANARDFLHPTAWCDVNHNRNHPNNDKDDKAQKEQPPQKTNNNDNNNKYIIYNKFGTLLFQRESWHSPYNVVAWHGNYVPFKYNLESFCAINSVTFDHLDPSIYTVLTCNSGGNHAEPLADFVIFPPRIMATDSNTFRPPWFHRNCMTEFMGLISGTYDAKQQQQQQQQKKSGTGSGGGFVPGGASLHSCMTPHGPDTVSYEKAIADECLSPTKYTGGLAFMFETTCMMHISHYALHCPHRDVEYASCWSDLKDNFSACDPLKRVQEEAKQQQQQG